MNYLSVDVGTTCCKCQLFDEQGNILFYRSREYALKCRGEELYVDLSAVKESVYSLISAASSEYKISSVCVSSFGETFAALDKNDELLFDPMLYTDPRGEEEASEVLRTVGGEKIFSITGTSPHGMYSLYKLLWLKKHRRDLYDRIDKVLLIGDYIGYLLTGRRVIDYSLAARTGLFDIRRFEFSKELCDCFGVRRAWFSSPQRAGTVVGTIENGRLGLHGCTLVLGAHDQVTTALGAGIVSPGKAVDGLGTVECINVVYEGVKSDPEMGKAGFCCIPYAVEGLYCSYIVTYSCGSIVKWFKNELLHGYRGDEASVYSYLENRMPEGPTDLLLLPLFSGSFIPWQDPAARGALIGLTARTTDGEIYRAIMEGLSMEMRFETEIAASFGIAVNSAVATGGGANSGKWLQIKADVQGIPYTTLRSSEGGLCGCAVLQATAMSGASFEEAAAVFVRAEQRFEPHENVKYEEKFSKFKKVYPAVKELF